MFPDSLIGIFICFGPLILFAIIFFGSSIGWMSNGRMKLLRLNDWAEQQIMWLTHRVGNSLIVQKTKEKTARHIKTKKSHAGSISVAQMG